MGKNFLFLLIYTVISNITCSENIFSPNNDVNIAEENFRQQFIKAYETIPNNSTIIALKKSGEAIDISSLVNNFIAAHKELLISYEKDKDKDNNVIYFLQKKISNLETLLGKMNLRHDSELEFYQDYINKINEYIKSVNVINSDKNNQNLNRLERLESMNKRFKILCVVLLLSSVGMYKYFTDIKIKISIDNSYLYLKDSITKQAQSLKTKSISIYNKAKNYLTRRYLINKKKRLISNLETILKFKKKQ